MGYIKVKIEQARAIIALVILAVAGVLASWIMPAPLDKLLKMFMLDAGIKFNEALDDIKDTMDMKMAIEKRKKLKVVKDEYSS